VVNFVGKFRVDFFALLLAIIFIIYSVDKLLFVNNIKYIYNFLYIMKSCCTCFMLVLLAIEGFKKNELLLILLCGFFCILGLFGAVNFQTFDRVTINIVALFISVMSFSRVKNKFAFLSLMGKYYFFYILLLVLLVKLSIINGGCGNKACTTDNLGFFSHNIPSFMVFSSVCCFMLLGRVRWLVAALVLFAYLVLLCSTRSTLLVVILLGLIYFFLVWASNFFERKVMLCLTYLILTIFVLFGLVFTFFPGYLMNTFPSLDSIFSYRLQLLVRNLGILSWRNFIFGGAKVEVDSSILSLFGSFGFLSLYLFYVWVYYTLSCLVKKECFLQVAFILVFIPFMAIENMLTPSFIYAVLFLYFLWDSNQNIGLFSSGALYKTKIDNRGS
jgi:hypothetical protein